MAKRLPQLSDEAEAALKKYDKAVRALLEKLSGPRAADFTYSETQMLLHSLERPAEELTMAINREKRRLQHVASDTATMLLDALAGLDGRSTNIAAAAWLARFQPQDL